MTPDQILTSLSQLDHQKRPVTRVAIVFFSLVCLSLGGMQGWSVYKARSVQLAEATEEAISRTRFLADHVGHTLDRADTALLDLGERVQREQSGGDPFLLDPYLKARVARVPMLQTVGIFDADGKPIAVTEGDLPSDTIREHTVRHRYLPTPEVVVGTPLRSADGQWLLPLSRPLPGANGSFNGVVLGMLKLAQFHAFDEASGMGATGRLLLALETGQLVLSRPHVEAQVGRDLRNNILFTLRRTHGLTGAALVPGSEGQPDQLYSWNRTAGYPLVVATTRSSDDILASWWDSAYLSTAGVSLLILIQMWLGVRLYGQISLREQLDKQRRSLQKLLVSKSRSLRQQALRDGLTGIPNRRQFDTRLLREFNRAMAEAWPLALVILDVDHFKKYNDMYGHPAGDECLKFVAGRINSGRRRSQDLAVRLGGEEFAILLPNTGLRGAIAVAEAIRKSVAAQRLTHIPGVSHSVTVSCGVHALVPTAGMAPSELVDAADRALYLAKASGRNRVRAEGSEPPSGVKRLALVVSK